MPLRRLILISGLVLAVVAMSPAAAMGAAKGADRPLKGTTTTTTTVNLITGAGSSVSSGHLSHLGAVTGSGDAQFALVGPNGFSFTGTATTVAANGDKLFTATSGMGTLGPPVQSTAVNTITGGTGRFANAAGTFTTMGTSTSVSTVGSIETITSTSTIKGTISLPKPQDTGTVYVTNEGTPGGDDVSQYAIGHAGNLFPLSPPTVATGLTPIFLAVTPDGKSVYVSSEVDGTVSQYTADPLTGTLSPKTPPTVAPGPFPVGIAVTPDGKSAYVASFLNADIAQYNIDPVTGALSPKTPPAVAPGGPAGPWGVAVTPDGKSAYVTDRGTNTVLQYDIAPTTGDLSPKTPASIPAGAGNEVNEVAVTPNGKSVYVTNTGGGFGNTLSQYNVDPVTGALSPKVPATVATGLGPFGVAVTPDGRSVYVTNVGNELGPPPGTTLSEYNVNPLTGALSPKVPATVATGTGPRGIAVTPDGKNAYVTNTGDDTVSQYSIDALTGALSPNNPATVATGSGPTDVAVGPLPGPSRRSPSPRRP
jgi:6-phosphogluconolactonase